MLLENLLKIKNGMVISNYKEMCDLLGEKTKGGNSKKSQIREWERFIKFHNEGYKFIVDEIYKEPKEKLDLRGRDGLLSNDIQPLILNILANTDGNTVCLSCSKLLEKLKMINQNYSIGRRNIYLFSELLEVDKNVVYDFYQYEHCKLKSSLESALNTLNNKRLISWSKVTMICEEVESIIPDKKGNLKFIKNNREATEEEIRFLLGIDKEVLEEMGLTSMRDIYGTARYDKFKKKVKEKLKLSNTKILYSYKAYQIIQLKEYVIRELEEEEKRLKEEELNFKILQSAYKSIREKHKNAIENLTTEWGIKQDLSSIKLIRCSDNYIETSNKICQTVIANTGEFINLLDQYKDTYCKV